MRLIKTLFIAITLFAAVAGAGLYGYWQGWHIASLSPDELSAQLNPHYQSFVPEGRGPFPTVVGYHGCSGVLKGSQDWATFLVQQGYAVVLIDSMQHRELDWPDVCAGKKLWGTERAGDVLVSLHDVRQLPFVDTNNLHLLGWSHGGWTVLDTLAILSAGHKPPNLTQLPRTLLEGVRSAVVFYPYCGLPSRARGGWLQQIPVHFVFAENDEIISNDDCREIVTHQQSAGMPVTATTYPDVNHAFDMRVEDFFEGSPFTDIATRDQSWNDVLKFLNNRR